MLRKRKMIFLVVIALAIIVSAGLVLKMALDRTTFTKNFVDSKLGGGNAPSFTALRPNGNQDVKFESLKADQAYAFDDQIAGTDITVSQQPLPQDFTSNPDQSVANLAQKYNATTKLSAGGTTIYTGHSAAGNQTTIFTKNNLLVFITSKKTVANDRLTAYIQSLR